MGVIKGSVSGHYFYSSSQKMKEMKKGADRWKRTLLSVTFKSRRFTYKGLDMKQQQQENKPLFRFGKKKLHFPNQLRFSNQ